MKFRAAQFAIFFALLTVSQGRPQRTTGNQNAQVSSNNGDVSDAVRPSILFVRPVFDRAGRRIEYDDDGIDEDAIVSRNRNGDSNSDDEEEGGNNGDVSGRRRNGNQRRGNRGRDGRVRHPVARPPPGAGSFSDLITFVEEDNDESSDSIEEEELSLPTFGHPDTVLKATEELRQRDRNQETFIALGGSNAGVLPLKGEDPGALNLFPPLRPAFRVP